MSVQPIGGPDVALRLGYEAFGDKRIEAYLDRSSSQSNGPLHKAAYANGTASREGPA